MIDGHIDNTMTVGNINDTMIVNIIDKTKDKESITKFEKCSRKRTIIYKVQKVSLK